MISVSQHKRRQLSDSVRDCLRDSYRLNVVSLSILSSHSHNSIYKVVDISNNTYVVKFVPIQKVAGIRVQQRIESTLLKRGIAIPRTLKNLDGNEYTVDKKAAQAIIVTEFVPGSVYRNSRHMSSTHLETAARLLAKIHNFPIPNLPLKFSSLSSRVRSSAVLYETLAAQADLLKILPKHLLRAIRQRAELLDITPLSTDLERKESLCVIHGDYAPANMVFSDDKTCHVLDWEHAGIWYWQYDLFRAVSNFASSGRFTAYDSVKNTDDIAFFLSCYFRYRKGIRERELDLLLRMPRLYCLIDVFPFEALRNLDFTAMERYIPRSPVALRWWIDHEKFFKEQVIKSYT